MENNQRKRPRIDFSREEMGWIQKRINPEALRKRQEGGVFDNTVQNDKVLYRDSKAARRAEEQAHAEKINRDINRAGEEASKKSLEQERLTVERQIREGLDIRNNILNQEKRLGIDGALSYSELERAQMSRTLVGKKNPLKGKKKDLEVLGKTKRKRKTRKPSERKTDRLLQAKLDRIRKQGKNKVKANLKNKEAKKDLVITLDGKKINIDRLRGTGKYSLPAQKRNNDSGRQALRAERVKRARMQAQIRKRDEYTR